MYSAEITTFINAWRGYLVGHRRNWYPHQRSNLWGFRAGIVIARPSSHLLHFRRVVELLVSLFRTGSTLWAWGMIPLPEGRRLLPEDFIPRTQIWGKAYRVWHSGHFSNHAQVLRFRQFCRGGRKQRRNRRRPKLEHKQRPLSRAAKRRVRRVRRVRRNWRRLRRRGELPIRCYRGFRFSSRNNGLSNALFLYPRKLLRKSLSFCSKSRYFSTLPRIRSCRRRVEGFQNFSASNFNKSLRASRPRAPKKYLAWVTRCLNRVTQASRTVRPARLSRSYFFRLTRWAPPAKFSTLAANVNQTHIQGRLARQRQKLAFEMIKAHTRFVQAFRVHKKSSRVGLNRLQKFTWLGEFSRRIRNKRWARQRSQPEVLPGVTTAGGLTYRQQAFLTETKAISVPFVWFCGAEVRPNFTPWLVLWNQDKEHAESLMKFFDEIWFYTQQLLLLRLMTRRISYQM